LGPFLKKLKIFFFPRGINLELFLGMVMHFEMISAGGLLLCHYYFFNGSYDQFFDEGFEELMALNIFLNLFQKRRLIRLGNKFLPLRKSNTTDDQVLSKISAYFSKKN